MRSSVHASVAVMLAAALSCCGEAAEASCSSSRPFTSPLMTASRFGLVDASSGEFWSLGGGASAPGMGHDNGMFGICDWAFGFMGGCYEEMDAFLLQGDWAAPGVDGCVDQGGAGPSLDGDECMVVMFHLTDFTGIPYAAVLSQRVSGGRFNFNPPGFDFSPVPTPTITRVRPIGSMAELSVRIPPGLPAGTFLGTGCTQGVIAGWDVVARRPPGNGWVPTGPPSPFGQEATVAVNCASDNDFLLASRTVFDSGYTTDRSLSIGPIAASSDSDGDGRSDRPPRLGRSIRSDGRRLRAVRVAAHRAALTWRHCGVHGDTVDIWPVRMGVVGRDERI